MEVYAQKPVFEVVDEPFVIVSLVPFFCLVSLIGIVGFVQFIVDKDFLLTPSPNDTFVGMIDYTGRIATIDAMNVKDRLDIKQLIAQNQFLKDLCYSKSNEWKSEYELRIGSTYLRLKLEMSRITSKEERFFCFNPESIIEVSVGYDADKVDIGKLQLMLQARNIPLKEAKLNLQYETL